MNSRSNSKNRVDSKTGLAELLKLFSYISPYKKKFYLAFCCLFITASLALAFPYLMGSLLGGAMSTGERVADSGFVSENINKVTQLLILVLGVQAFIAYWRIRWFAYAGESALADIRKETFGKLVMLPLSYYSENKVGEICSRLSADLSLIRDTIIMTLPQIIRQSVMLIGGIIFIAWSSPKLTMIMLLCIPLVLSLLWFFGRGIKEKTAKSQDELAESNVIVEESLHGIVNVKAFTNEQYEKRRYAGSLSDFIDLTMSAAKARAFFVSFIIFALFGVITFVVWYGAGMLSDGEISSEKFTRFVLFSIFVGAAMGSFPEIMSQLYKAVGATERIREILSEKDENNDGTGLIELEMKGGIEINDLSFCYPSRDEVVVLDDISFSVQPGERVAIVGASGAGKSTIIKLLLKLYKPSSGDIKFDGTSSERLSVDSIRSQISIVPQEVFLFGGTIKENIAYGAIDADESQIIDAAMKANAHDFIENLSDGYETTVGDRGVKLSGGERQRIAIARAILSNPSILLLDEATSSLDSESELLVQQALEGLMSERTCIVVAHRLSTVRSVNRIIALKDGKIVESGSHEELFQKEGGVYKTLYELQFGEPSDL